MRILCRFVSKFQKCHLFLSTTIGNANKCISKMCRHLLYLFFGHCAAKNKDIALIFRILVVCMYLDYIYSVFWITWKFRILYAIIFLNKMKFWILYAIIFRNKMKFEILNFENKKYQNPRYLFCKAFHFTPFGLYWLQLTSKLNILPVSKHLLFFLPQMVKHDVNKSIFFKKILVRCFWNFGGRRQINAKEGTESFASISAQFELSRKSGRGRNSSPQRGACYM